MSISLYDLSQQYLADLAQLEDLDLPAQTVADTLEGLTGDLSVKAQNVVGFSRGLHAQAAAKREAAKSMMDSADRIEKRAKDLEAYTLTCMQAAGIQKIECPWFTLSIAKNPAAVVIEDAALIPVAYMTDPNPPAPAPDKGLIKKALQDGHDVNGAKLVQGVRLAIK